LDCANDLAIRTNLRKSKMHATCSRSDSFSKEF
jgi:hypothetical protein